jgi:hypothetical protein
VLTEGVGERNLTLWQTDNDPIGLPLRTLEWDQVPVRPGSSNNLVTQFGAYAPALFIDLDGNGSPDLTIPVTSRFTGGGGPTLLADLNGGGP